jgi:thiamine biosynthesis lipoprotein
MAAEARFRSMGSDVHVIVVGGRARLLDVATGFVGELESRWSRFRPTSEVSRLNALAGSPVTVSPKTMALVQRALEGAGITEGRYDPTVLGAVLRAGYDRSFEQLSDHSPRGRSSLTDGYERILVDASSSTVTLPRDVGFDPGGIGKGFAADLLVQELLAQGAAGACVNVGGDLRVEGVAPQGESWVVAIEHPMGAKPAATIALRGGAVATTSRMRRAWGPESDRRHHLIDPSTGQPAVSGLASATVVAAEAWHAEVVAKAAFLAGLSEGLFVLASTGTDGLLVDDRGTVYPSFRFDGFTGKDGAPSAAA